MAQVSMTAGQSRLGAWSKGQEEGDGKGTMWTELSRSVSLDLGGGRCAHPS